MYTQIEKSMRNDDINVGDLVKGHFEGIKFRYGIVVALLPGLTNGSWCRPTVMWEDGKLKSHVSSVEIKRVKAGDKL